jgi:hypothetical protein
MKFRASVDLNGKTATGIVVPDDVVEALANGKRPKVAVTIAGYTYRTTVAPMGGRFLIPLAAEHREAAGVSAGEVVVVDIVVDDQPREVEVPQDLAKALGGAPRARETFDGLSFTHRKEWVRWIEEAKKPETRSNRIAKAVAGLNEGKRMR